MTKEEVLTALENKGLDEIIEIIEDAASGDLVELELVESIGLVHDDLLNQKVIQLLQQLGVTIIYVTDEDEGEDE